MEYRTVVQLGHDFKSMKAQTIIGDTTIPSHASPQLVVKKFESLFKSMNLDVQVQIQYGDHLVSRDLTCSIDYWAVQQQTKLYKANHFTISLSSPKDMDEKIFVQSVHSALDMTSTLFARDFTMQNVTQEQDIEVRKVDDCEHPVTSKTLRKSVTKLISSKLGTTKNFVLVFCFLLLRVLYCLCGI